MALPLYCRNIRINGNIHLDAEGPLLLACNHPNSFLDAVILATIFKKPIYSLARGDAFKNDKAAKMLKKLNILPVYRLSEGAEHLEHNYHTFDACIEIFKQNGIVLIFSEGKCEYEWHLRPLKKGTARLAFNSWQQGIPLKVLPVGLNYHSFRSFGKNVHINFGNIISSDNFTDLESKGTNINAFNSMLNNELSRLVYEIEKNDTQKLLETFEIKVPAVKKILLAIPALFGYLFHAPLYYPIKSYVSKHPLFNLHYDSVVAGMFLVGYAFYLLLLCGFAYAIHLPYWWALLLIVPFCGWSFIQLKKQYK